MQSTRAGAGWGLGLVVVVLLANLVRYPSFRFGPEYALATGTTLFEGFRRQGRWALALYGALTVATMFTVLAVVAAMTAGLFIALFGLELPVGPVAIGTIALGGILVGVGRYKVLDRVSKVIVVLLTVSTVIAAALALPRVDLGTFAIVPPLDALGIAFVVQLAGWMPAGTDVAAWQSAWTLERAKESGAAPDTRAAMLDFHVGYVGTVVLALLFVVLGAGTMYGTGETFERAPGAFSGQVISLYVRALGAWARPLIGVAALATMVSTTLAVIDGFPRAIASLARAWTRPESSHESSESDPVWRRIYLASIALLGLGAVAVLMAQSALLTLVAIATSASFLTAPVLAWLGHRAMHADEVPSAARPRPWLTYFSLACIAVQAAFALYFLWLTYLAG